MVVVPDELERADRAAKRVAATGKVGCFEFASGFD